MQSGHVGAGSSSDPNGLLNRILYGGFLDEGSNRACGMSVDRTCGWSGPSYDISWACLNPIQESITQQLIPAPSWPLQHTCRRGSCPTIARPQPHNVAKTCRTNQTPTDLSDPEPSISPPASCTARPASCHHRSASVSFQLHRNNAQTVRDSRHPIRSSATPSLSHLRVLPRRRALPPAVALPRDTGRRQPNSEEPRRRSPPPAPPPVDPQIPHLPDPAARRALQAPSVTTRTTPLVQTALPVEQGRCLGRGA